MSFRVFTKTSSMEYRSYGGGIGRGPPLISWGPCVGPIAAGDLKVGEGRKKGGLERQCHSGGFRRITITEHGEPIDPCR